MSAPDTEVMAIYREREQERERVREIQRQWREQNPEYGRQWREQNREQVRENRRQYREQNREQIRESKRQYRQKNPEQVREYLRQWREQNPERRQEQRRRRRALKAGAISEPYTLAEIAKNDLYTCGLCDLPVDMAVSGRALMGPTLDHVIPISWGGPDTPDNVQLAHSRCNSIKQARTDPDRAAYWLFGLLLPKKIMPGAVWADAA